MKYGVLYHKTTTNIGDDFQSYAAARFLPHIDYLINRETIDEFQSENHEDVVCIMNAWWMWNKWHFPPAEDIIPLFVAFHYSEYGKDRMSNNGMEYVKYQFLEGKGKEYMNYHGPIGCRDMATVNSLKEIGIDSYFSGCLTLTLDKFKIDPPLREYICIVDTSEAVVQCVKEMVRKSGKDIDIIESTHFNDYRYVECTWEERVQEVERRLKIYQNAKCVITRKLHCALPCLALETPVFLVNADFISTRFQPYYDWLRKATTQQFLSGEYEYDIFNPPNNLDFYKETRQALKSSVNTFIDLCENKGALKGKYEQKCEEFLMWRIETMKSVLDEAFWDYRRKNEKIKDMERELTSKLNEYKNATQLKDKEIENIKMKLENQKMEIENQKKILNAKMVKPVVKLRKIIQKTGFFKKH